MVPARRSAAAPQRVTLLADATSIAPADAPPSGAAVWASLARLAAIIAAVVCALYVLLSSAPPITRCVRTPQPHERTRLRVLRTPRSEAAWILPSLRVSLTVSCRSLACMPLVHVWSSPDCEGVRLSEVVTGVLPTWLGGGGDVLATVKRLGVLRGRRCARVYYLRFYFVHRPCALC